MRYACISVFVLVSACNPLAKPQVDAFYYPDRYDLTNFKASYDVGSVDACRDWVHAKAFELNDRGIRRGDYECGIGPKQKYGTTVYDKTTR